MKRLSELLLAAGHTGLRDARGPLGLTQRQAGGRFTHDEADALIARLEAEAEAGTQVEPEVEPGGLPPGSVASPVFNRGADDRINDLHKLPDEVLAAELQRRGWIVMEP